MRTFCCKRDPLWPNGPCSQHLDEEPWEEVLINLSSLPNDYIYSNWFLWVDGIFNFEFVLSKMFHGEGGSSLKKDFLIRGNYLLGKSNVYLYHVHGTKDYVISSEGFKKIPKSHFYFFKVMSEHVCLKISRQSVYQSVYRQLNLSPDQAEQFTDFYLSQGKDKNCHSSFEGFPKKVFEVSQELRELRELLELENESCNSWSNAL